MQLRKGINLLMDRGQGGQEIVIVLDTLTRRFFSLPGEIAPVLEALRAPCEMEDIMLGPGEDFGVEAVEHLLRQLGQKRLLEDGTPPDAVREAVGEEARKTGWQTFLSALRSAKEHVPIYREKLGPIDLDAIASRDDLLALPLLEKADVRAHYPDGFVPDTHDLQELLVSNAVVRGVSSGTSAGERLSTLHTREAWYKQMIAGALLNSKLHPHIESPNATFTTMHCADPDVCVTHLARMEDRIRAGTRLLLFPPEDPGAPTLQEVHKTIEEITKHGAVWVDCNGTYMAALTYAMIDAGITPPKINVMTCGFEFVSGIHRKVLAETWNVPVFDRFSASEFGNYIALECEHGNYHVNDQYYYAEIVRNGRHVAPGELGVLVLSTLRETLPMLRYNTHDIVVAGAAGTCPCGSMNTRIESFSGRQKDLLVAADGTPRTERDVDNALARVSGLRFYQIEQASLRQHSVKVVADPKADGDRVRAEVLSVLGELMGAGVEIRVDRARRIYPENSGKFRFTRSNVPDCELLVSV